MSKVGLYLDCLNIFWKRHKRYNPGVTWMDLTIYFRLNGRLVKRCPTILSADDRMLQQDWIKYKKSPGNRKWCLGGSTGLKDLISKKKVRFRYYYDTPDDKRPWQDDLSTAPVNKEGRKPYLTDILVPASLLTISWIKKAALVYLKNNFNVIAKLKDVKLLRIPKNEEIEAEWERLCFSIDKSDQLKKFEIIPKKDKKLHK